MNIQIYGKPKCFDTKKAERYFKERRIKYQYVDLAKNTMSQGEFKKIKAAIGSLEALIDTGSKLYDSSFIKYLAGEQAKEEKLLLNQTLFKTPIVRNANKIILGYCPDVWSEWKWAK